MIGFASSNFYDVVDMFWVAKLGPENVAAITIFFSFYWVISSSNMIAGAGSVAVISRRYGEKNIEYTEAAIKDAILLKWILAIACGGIGYILLGTALDLLGAEGRVLELAFDYGTVQLIGIGFSFSSYTMYTALRGVGDPNKAMILMVSGVILNLILDPFLIFGWWIFPEMGVVGAALASVIAYCYTFIAGMIIFYGGFTTVRLYVRGKVPVNVSRMMKMMKIGFPSGISSISFSLARMVIMPIIAVFGTSVVAVYGMGTRVSALGITVIVGMGLGLAALIGQSLGAAKLERAKQTANTALMFAVALMGSFGAIYFVGAPVIVRFFFNEEPMLSLGITLIRIFSLAMPAIGLEITMEMIYSGAGENKTPMFFSILSSWGFQIPFILLAVKVMDFNQNGVWWAMVAASILTASLFYMWFRKGKWLKVQV